MNDNPKDPYAAPMPDLPPEQSTQDAERSVACLRCGTPMTECNVSNGPTVMPVEMMKQGLLFGKYNDLKYQSGMMAMVCKNCGYTEFYARELNKLNLGYERNPLNPDDWR